MAEDTNNKQPQNEYQPKYWIGGCLWGNVFQYDRFIRYGIWENGYKKTPGTKGNIVKKGDYIALKKEKQIKAIGKAIEDAKENKVKVDWFIEDIKIDYAYPATFAEIQNLEIKKKVIEEIKQYEDKKWNYKTNAKIYWNIPTT